MIAEVFEITLYVLVCGLIAYWVYRTWTKIDIQEKLAKAKKVEQDYQEVSKFEQDHKDLSEKLEKVKQFKKKEF